MRRIIVPALLVLALSVPAGVALTGTATANPAPAAGSAAEQGRFFPSVIPLPNGWQPEGIATGRGTSFYVGSLREIGRAHV